MKILVLGDFHARFTSKLKERIAREKFDFVIGVGDYAGIEEWSEYFGVMFKALSAGLPWISAKDYFGAKKYRKLVKKDEILTKKVLGDLNKLGNGKKVIFIFGNNDDDWYKYPFDVKSKVKKGRLRFLRGLKNMKDVTYFLTRYNGVGIAGFGGYMDVAANWDKRKDDGESYNRMRKRMKKSEEKLIRMMKNKPEILILHYPPEGAFDKIIQKGNPFHGRKVGIEMFRSVIMRFKPKLVLCGHMHEYQGMKKIGKSLVVNPGDASRNKYAVIDYPTDNQGNLTGKIKVKFGR